jgi:hypothetical protein
MLNFTDFQELCNLSIVAALSRLCSTGLKQVKAFAETCPRLPLEIKHHDTSLGTRFDLVRAQALA